MKGFLCAILLCFALGAQSQTFEMRLGNAGGGTIAVEMRATSGPAPTTSNFLTDLVFGICWSNSYGVSLGTLNTNYTILKAGSEVVTGSTRYQLFAKDPNPINFPANWTINQWVTIMTIPNTMTSYGFGTFSLCPASIQELNINIDLNDFTPTNAGAATGVPLGPPYGPESIVTAEYFVDNDPGAGNGTAISVTQGDTVSGSFNLNVTGLSAGFHNLFIRGKNLNGKWGFADRRLFYIAPFTSPLPDQSIVRAEYFIDNDPGTGNGIPLPVPTPGDTVIGQNVPIQISECLTPGAHRLYVRGQAANGIWGFEDYTTFTIENIDARIQSISHTPAGCIISNNETVSVTVRNNGSNTIGAGLVQVNLNVSGANAGTYGPFTNAAAIAPNSSVVIQVTGVNLSIPGLNTLAATITACNDDPAGNSASIQVVGDGTLPVVDPVPNQILCPGSLTNPIVFTGDTPGATYDWTNNAAAIGLAANGAGDIAAFSAQNPGLSALVATISVTATLNGCTGAPRVFTITANAAPLVIISGNQSICPGQTTTMLSASGANNYLWSTGATTHNISVASTGTYTVTATDGNGCSGTAVANVIANPLPTPAINGNLNICPGATTTLTATGANSYAWSTGSSSQTINVGTAGAYTVTATDANGCSATTSATLAVAAAPNLQISGDLLLCPGSSTVLTATGGETYLWSTGASGDAIATATGGIFTVTATDASGCTGTTSATVTANTQPNPAISGGLTICAGAMTTLTASGGSNYTWSTGANSTAINTGTAGTYTVTATNAGGCTASTSVTVVVNSLPVPGISGSQGICPGQSTTLTASGGSTYAWSTGVNTAAATITNTGIYTVTVTNAAGCTASASASVEAYPPAAAAISGNLNTCPGNPTTLTASGGNGFSWSTGQNTASISVDAAGTYTVLVVNSYGCIGTTSATVTADPVPSPQIAGNQSICPGQTTILTASGGNTYAWSTGENSAAIVVGNTGTYTVTATNAAGCTASVSAAIALTTPPTAGISGNLNICPGATTTLTASGGNSYAWSTGANTASINTGTAGTYTATVTNAAGCTATASATVAQNTPPAAGISGATGICPGATTTLTATGGNTYAWSTGVNSTSINTGTAGTYTVTATDANGCTASATAAVTALSPPGAAISGAGGICPGGSILLTASGGNSYNWNTGAATATLTAGTPGTYTVTATGANGCTASATAAVTANSVPVPGISGTTVVCSGASTIFTASGGNSYLWSTGENTTAISTGAAGTYTVTATNAQGCTATATASLTVNTLPVAGISGSTNICSGASTTLTATGGTSYAWSTGANTAAISAGTAGAYTVTATDANGCTATTSATVSVNALPVAGISGALTICPGESTQLTASGGNAYAWSTGANSTAISVNSAGTFTVTATNAAGCTATASATTTVNAVLSVEIAGVLNVCSGQSTVLTASGGNTYAWNTGETTVSISAATAGTYSVTATSATGCTGTTSATLTVNALPNASISGSLAICNGQSTTLTASGGTSYLWNTSANTASISASGGTYTVTATNANGCTATASATVNVGTPPTPGISGNLNICAGQLTILTASGGNSYAWSTGANTTSISASVAGTYTVTATDPAGCTATATASLVVNALPAPGISGVLAICAGGSTTLTATGGNSYAWSTGANTTSISASVAGTYTVTATNGAGCTATATAALTVNALPTPGISGTLAICAGASTTLTATGGTSYAWSTGANTTSISTSIAGTYTVTATNAAGCTATATAALTVNALPNAGISGGLSICTGQLTILTASGGNSYVWSTGVAAANITTGTAGTYTVTATNAAGCTATATATLVVNALPNGAITGTLAICDGQSTTLTGTGGTSYAWSTGANTASISTGTAGTYTVTVTNGAGCSASTTAAVVVSTLPTPGISGASSICAGQTTQLNATGGTSYLWSTGAITASINVSTAGTYTVTASNAAGCSATATAALTVNALPNAAISGDLSICAGETTQLTASGGNSYAWNTGVMTAALSTGTAGTYTVVVTNAAGCTATATATLAVNALPAAAISGDLNICAGETTQLAASGGTSYLWSTGEGTASINAGTAGSYTVTVTNPAGCTDEASETLLVAPSPSVSISGNAILCENTTNTFTASGGVSYLWSNGFDTPAAKIASPGTYTVTATDANGCTGTASETMTEAPAIQITPNVTDPLCFGDATGNIILVISGGSGHAACAWSNGATTDDLLNVGAGIYSVTVTDDNGCTATTSASVSQPLALGIVPVVTNTDCNGNTGAISLNISGGTNPFTCLWSNNSTAESIIGLPVGTYWVTVTDDNGCTKAASAAVAVDNSVAAPLQVTCPTSVPDLTANSSCQASVGNYLGLILISGGCTGMLNPTVQNPAPGALVNPGTIVVTMTVSNNVGESATCLFNVKVIGNCH